MAWVTWRRVWAGCLLAAAVLYTIAFRSTQPGFVFSGFLLNSGDPWGYMSFSRSFATGGFLIDNPCAPYPAKPAFFNLLWFLVGKTQALLGLRFLPVYYALGILASGLMYGALWAFCRHFLDEGPRARLAFMLAGLGGGVGWILALLSDSVTFRVQPFDLFHHEGFPLVSAMFFPHLALSIALLTTVLLWFHRGVTTGKRGWSLGAAALLLCLGFFHPYQVVTVAAVSGLWVVTEQVLAGRRFFRGWLDLSFLAAVSLPPALYYRWLFQQPNWRAWAGANVVPSKALGVLLGLGPILLLAAVGLWRRRGECFGRLRFLVVWGVVGMGLLFSSPVFKFEAKFVEGLVLPLAILGAVGFIGREDRCAFRCQMRAALLVLALLPSTVVLAVESLGVVRGETLNFFPGSWEMGAYLYQGDVAVMRYLEKNPPRDGLLMVPPTEGRALVGAADVRVFVSGEHTTPDFQWRWRAAYEVYAAELSSLERYSLLKRVGATHLWYNSVWDFSLRPENEPYLTPVFLDRGSGIWRIEDWPAGEDTG